MTMMDRFLNIRKRHWVYKTAEIIVYEDLNHQPSDYESYILAFLNSL